MKLISPNSWFSISTIFATFAGFSFVVMGIFYTGALQFQSINTILLNSTMNVSPEEINLLAYKLLESAEQYTYTTLIWLIVGSLFAFLSLLSVTAGFITEMNANKSLSLKQPVNAKKFTSKSRKNL